MDKHLSGRGILRLWSLQCALILILAILSAVTLSMNAGISVVLGGMVCIIPNMYFASKLFKYQGARAARQIVNGFYKGEAMKMLLSMILFTLVFVCYKITPLPFFGSYIAILMTHWFAPWIIINKRNGPQSD